MDKIINRKIKIIQLLYSYKSSIEVEEIAKLMRLTKKTIRIELIDLANYLKSNDYGIRIVNSRNKVFIERDIVMKLDELTFSLQKESIFFFFTNALFNNNLNKNDLEGRYHYSDSHFHFHKNKYIEYLENSDMKLSPNPFNIIGDEIIIRFYFYNFYWKNYGKIEWPFTSIKYEKLILIIENIESATGISLNKIEKKKFAYWLAVIFKRTLNDDLLSSNQRIEKIIKLGENENFSFLIEEMFKNVSMVQHDLVFKEIDFILSVMFMILDEKNFRNLFIEKFFIYEFGDIFDFSMQFCENIRENFIFKDNNDSFIIMTKLVYNEFYNGRVLSGNIKNDLNKYDLDEDSIVYKLFSKAYAQVISKLFKKTNIFDKNKNQFLLWDNLKYIVFQIVDLRTFYPQLTIKINLERGYLEELNLRNSLKTLKYNFIYEINESRLTDLIITDIDLEDINNRSPYFIVNYIDAKINFNRLSYFIDKIVNTIYHLK
ncbi:helix-turn-helix domain-containing protein [Carnobacterium maltaromaticum]|uniref:helix-turn-helix domain-containing protein n=1 Tax=Carnobacterium maltaromaticum TaxID=2751 RepID=UPI00295E3EA9|nr:helix-turn-helix domain-containing protein [Carnobacterium maltaromaticum]